MIPPVYVSACVRDAERRVLHPFTVDRIIDQTRREAAARDEPIAPWSPEGAMVFHAERQAARDTSAPRR